MNVALYLRVSTEEQAKGHSMDSQRQALEDWAKREGWNVVRHYGDAGVSGTTALGRRAFGEMVRDAEAYQFAAVLVLRLDRFARSVSDSATYRRRLAGAGVRLLSLQEPSDEGASGFLTRGLHELLAEYYSVELAEKVSRGKRTRALKGYPAGDIPYGYRSTGAQSPAELVPEEAEVVRYCFEVYATGQFSLQELADDLNTLGHQMRTKTGLRPFGQKSIRSILANRFYLGDITYRGEVVARGVHQPLLAPVLFQKVASALTKRAASPVAYSRHPKHVYLLSGLGLCRGCSGPLWGNVDRVGRRYRCAARRQGRQCPHASKGALAAPVEASLSALFLNVALPADWQERIWQLAGEGAEREPLEAERRRLEARLARAQRELLLGDVEPELARRVVRETRATLGKIQPPSENLGDRARWVLSIPHLWPMMTEDERRDLVRATMDHVAVDLGAATVTEFSPKADLAPLFRVMAHAQTAPVEVCTWRPRSGSRAQSPDSWFRLSA